MTLKNKHLYVFDTFRLDPQRRLLLHLDAPVPLTPKAFTTLLFLVQNSGRIIGKDELMQVVWPDSFVEEVGLARNISVLRKALGEGSNGNRYIVTIPGQGYSFVAEVRTLEEESAEPAILEPVRDNLAIEGEKELAVKSDEAGMGHDSGSAKFLIRERKYRNRGSSSGLIITAVLVSGIAFGFYKWIGQKKPIVPAALKITKVTTTGKSLSPAISPDGKYVAFFTSEDGENSLWIRQMMTNSNVQIIPRSKAMYRGLTFSPDGNYLCYVGNEAGEGERALYQMPALGGVARKLIPGVDGSFTLAPDSQRIAFLRDEHALIVANLDGTGERTLATRSSPDLFYAVAWSPDGKRVACAGVRSGQEMDADLVEVEVESGVQKTLTQNWNWIHQVIWLPDSSGLVVVANDKQGSPMQLWQLSYPSGEVRRITTDLNSYSHLSLTADAKALVMAQSIRTLHLWVVPNGDAQHARQITFGSEWDGYSGLAWTPDGKIVYSSLASGRPEIWIMEADGSHPRQLTTDLGSDRLGLSVSPDGRYIAFVSARGENWRGGPGNIWRIDIDGRNPKQLSKVGTLPFFSPDSQWVFYRTQEAVWKVPIEGGESVQLTGPYSYIIDISPDGKLLAYRDEATKKVGVILSEGGKPGRIFADIPSTELRPLPRWTPDGQALSYLATHEGVSNIWLQPIDGSSSRPLTDFKTARIHYYAWSCDGKYLAVAGGAQVRMWS